MKQKDKKLIKEFEIDPYQGAAALVTTFKIPNYRLVEMNRKGKKVKCIYEKVKCIYEKELGELKNDS